MRIPVEIKKRDQKVLDIIDTCLKSMGDRRLRYERRRRWYLFGQDSEMHVRYNRLHAHTDLVSSFMFTPEVVRFTVSRKDRKIQGESEIIEALGDAMRTEAVSSGLLADFSQALDWALVYDSMFLKMGWNKSKAAPQAKIIDPYSMAVYDETEPELEDQWAFVYLFREPYETAVRRLMRAGKGKDIPKLSEARPGPKDELTPVERSLIISMTGGANIGGPIIGQAPLGQYDVPTDYRGEAPPKYVEMKELWVWEEEEEDYRQFLIAGDDIVVEDSKDYIEAISTMAKRAGASPHYETKTNKFFPGEHQFVHIRPYPLYDYFWGAAHSERLIRLQDWTNERLFQIDDILKRNVDPARVFTGFSGITESKMAAMFGPHASVAEMNPGAKVDELKPEMPEDLFREFEKIGELFLEASGLTQTIAGQGTPGVRSHEHAKQLGTTGSGRIKKAAIGLEPALSRMGELQLMILKHNDPEHLMTASGQEFISGQIEGDLEVHVDGHSHSPLFADETKKTAFSLYGESAIDKESLLRLVAPPGLQNLLERVRRMEQLRAQQMAMNPGATKAEDEAKRSHHKKGAA
jgi:hypothetical protein